MKPTLVLLLVLALHLCASVSGQSMYSRSSPVKSLTLKNFDKEVLRDNQISFVEFYAPWCGHCKSLKPEYTKAASTLKGVVNVAAVDCDNKDNKAVCDRYGVEGFPTIMVFEGSSDAPTPYQGERKSKAMIQHAKSLITSKVSKVTKKSAKKFLKKPEMPKVIIFLGTTEVPKYYEALSMQFSGRMKFGYALKKEKKLIKKYEVTDFPTIMVVQAQAPEDADMDPSLRYYSDKMNAVAVRSFLKMYALDPPAGQEEDFAIPHAVDQSCLQAHCTLNGGLCTLLIVSAYDMKRAVRNIDLMREAEEKSESVSSHWAWIDSDTQAEFVSKMFGITPSDYPQVVVWHPRKGRFATFIGSFGPTAVATFVTKVVKGKEATSAVLIGEDAEPLSLQSPESPEGEGKGTGESKGQCADLVKEITTGIKKKKKTKVTPDADDENREKHPFEQFGGVFAPQPMLKRGGKKRARIYPLKEETFDLHVTAREGQNWIVRFHHTKDSEAAAAHAAETGVEFNEKEWKRAAYSLKNMVNFATLDMDEYPVVGKSHGISSAGIYVFKAGSDKFTDSEEYDGELTGEALSEFAYALLDESFKKSGQTVHSIVPGGISLNQVIGNTPIQPKIILYTTPEKAEKEAPSLMKTLALEFPGYIQCAVMSSELLEDARGILGERFEKADPPVPSIFYIQGRPQEDPAVPGQVQVSMGSMVVSGKELNFNSMARQFDQMRITWPVQTQGEPIHDEL